MITQDWILAKSREMLEALWPIKNMNVAVSHLGACDGFALTASDEYGGCYCTLEDLGRDKFSQDQFAAFYLEPCIRQMANQLEIGRAYV